MDETTVSRETRESELVKVGYFRETPNDSGWFYEINTRDAVGIRVSQLMNDKYVKKISVQKDYGV